MHLFKYMHLISVCAYEPDIMVSRTNETYSRTLILITGILHAYRILVNPWWHAQGVR